MHEGEVSKRLGVKGIPAAAEEALIARDCLLAKETGGWLHVLHVSTGDGLAIIDLMRKRGAKVTAEVMPHHLVMSDEWVAGTRAMHNSAESGSDASPLHPDTKVNPPLRTPADTAELLAGLKAGSFDILATDHAPHAASEKRETSFERAAFGMIGLEVAVPTMLALVRAGHLSMTDVIYRFSTVPARLWNLPVGRLEPGGLANLTVIDPDRVWTVNDDTIQAMSKNTPLFGMSLTGKNVLTMLEGNIVYDDRA
jgi:dihydroorotase